MKLPSGTAQDFQQQCLGLTDKFNAIYNNLVRGLRASLRVTKNEKFTFRELVERYANSRPTRFRDQVSFLAEVAEVRNYITHQTYYPRQYPLLPGPAMVERLDQFVSRLKNPILADHRFIGPVRKVTSSTSLIEVLTTIRERSYSQFPVYDDGKYVGLLTENGISKWLSQEVAKNEGLAELEGVSVKEVIEAEESRENCMFMTRESQIIEIVNLFAENEELETVIITEDGKRNGNPLGIVTRWDITRLRPGLDA
jgi:predicted transcriptional regulator